MSTEEVSNDLLRSARVLVVGAGGIGCEVLKNLVLSGFENIVVLDLDTIDVSNLNRQFLFRKEHVNQSKAAVARQSALELNPNAHIEAFHTMIQDDMFSYEYMSQFKVVLSALDNPQARVYLNRLCFSAGVPLVECGTQGYAGQTYSVVHGVTECKECQPQSSSKTYPVCTLRNTPSEPVHCITWAKHVFAVLFGPKDEHNDMTSSIEDAVESICAASSNTFGSSTDGGGNSGIGIDDIVTPLETERVYANQVLKQDCPSAEQFAHKVFLRYFTNELYAQRTIKTRWVGRTPPECLFLSDYQDIPEIAFKSVAARTHKVQEPAVYVQTLLRALERMYNDRVDDFGNIDFSKDDSLSCEIVCCMSILRMLAYHIKPLSEFETLGVAANIVHAVATTNAIGAGFSVIEAIRIINAGDNFHNLDFKTIFISNRFPRMVDGTAMSGPSPHCFCGLPKFSLHCDLTKITLEQQYCTLETHIGEDIQLLPLLNKTIQGSILDMEDDHPEALTQTLHQLKFKYRDVIQCTEDSDARFQLQLVQISSDNNTNVISTAEHGSTLCGPLDLFKTHIETARIKKQQAEENMMKQHAAKMQQEKQNSGPIDLESDIEESTPQESILVSTHLDSTNDVIEL